MSSDSSIDPILTQSHNIDPELLEPQLDLETSSRFTPEEEAVSQLIFRLNILFFTYALPKMVDAKLFFLSRFSSPNPTLRKPQPTLFSKHPNTPKLSANMTEPCPYAPTT